MRDDLEPAPVGQWQPEVQVAEEDVGRDPSWGRLLGVFRAHRERHSGRLGLQVAVGGAGAGGARSGRCHPAA